MTYWPLAVSNMTFLDKLKIAKFLLTEEQWTQGKHVREYEKRWEKYTGAPHVIMVANGSVANELIALRRKYELEQSGEWPKKNKVVFPVVNWISSISPWVNIGFEPIFMDIGYNLTSYPKHIEKEIEGKEQEIAAVFYTSLLGFTGGIEDILTLCNKKGIALLMDNCEASFSKESFTCYGGESIHISNLVTSSTSLYFSHHTSGNQEGGLIFCQGQEEADWYRMARNHGMTRGMDKKYKNPLVDESFDFYLMGSNYRSTNLLAYMCSLDFDRALKFAYQRNILSRTFTYNLDWEKFEAPHYGCGGFVPLSIPIIAKKEGLINIVKGYLKAKGIEYRPIVTGNLLYQTTFKKYGNPKDFQHADYIHHNGIYIGLHTGVTKKMVEQLAKEISKL
jgi:dTDP-4-amino-4,6-dideoxygalactose transaminase